jgi:hypothetical protein
MRSALYYPHTTVDNKNLVKSALLLWDQLESIVPWSHFRHVYEDSEIARAMELIGVRHVPDEDEKRATHERLEELTRRKCPPEIYFRPRANGPEIYEMYPEKLLHHSWDLLKRKQMRGELLPNSDYPLSEYAGLMIMSVLADCCAGTTRSRITDRGDAYATLAGFLRGIPAGEKIRKVDAWGELVPISLKAINISKLSMERLIKLREREAKESGHSLRDLRHRYTDGLEKYVSRLANEKSTKKDALEIQRQFEEDMKTDVRDLKKELGFARNEVFLSKEFFATVLTGVGTAASWLFGMPLEIEGVITAAGGPAAIGGLLGVRNKYLQAREDVLKRHPMAYLYEARGHGIGK